MLDSPLKRPQVTLLFLYSIMLIFASIDLEQSSAAEELHHFELTSGLKDSTDMQPREIIFPVEYPGRIEVYASWKPRNKKLTFTLYDQERKAIVGKKERSPLHLVYDYNKESFEKSKNLGNSFRVEISHSLFLSINGDVKIVTPDKTDIDEENHDIIRGPYGTFIEERD
ncbi:MAG: hypothetical protein D8M57_15365 [Candidatus Scalindua sp. AMX11]|nr:MAG: hypothetical protein DWQ00_02285 [Candidatus Scalindua sp.]NOG84028.1 hypothetical protein [Planctomycetota bacterium]RZV88096.1 MAG: hypothetical protein EX341_07250 [Candidatus Scalindua sp. SCAELEC01]TDE64029.1 MAG: hypothetical protein D8M57_15365 [Candidatus Scalindua sp. AMX11]GJQ60899.1 MAG: hypothetical protein SCALA701_37000 [Candidatus Scalindua sp.]